MAEMQFLEQYNIHIKDINIVDVQLIPNSSNVSVTVFLIDSALCKRVRSKKKEKN